MIRIYCFVLIILFQNLSSRSQSLKLDKILYGAAYYHENMPYYRLDEDIKLMKEAGLSVVRVGESSWAKFEPQDGIFNFTWMDSIVDKMYQANIKVIMGTPTYSIPAWMAMKHPDIIATKLKGEKHYFGVRQNMDILNPQFLFYAERIVRKIAERYSKHPAVIGFQVDNETTTNDANTIYFQKGFINYLKQKYKTTDALNKAWGLSYWGMQIYNWEEMPTRDGTTNPSYKLEWERYNRSVATQYLKWQTNLVAEYKRKNQFTTHCFNMIWIMPNAKFDQVEISKSMEVASLNVYHDVQEGMQGHGIAIGGDFTRSFKNGNYLVTETNAQASDFGVASSQNPPFDGQFRLNAWHHIATGANMVEYWHWHSNHNGNEMFWKGILSHDLKPNRLYKEFQRTAKEINQISPTIVNHQKKSEVALLYSSDAHFANPTMDPGFSYDWEVLRMHKSLYKNNVPVDFVYPESNNLGKYKLIVVPSLYVASDTLLKKLVDYVKNGGNIIFGPRSGYCNEYAGARYTSQPSGLTELCGVYYQEVSKINKLALSTNPYQVPSDVNFIETWLEYLVPTTAKPLFYAKHDIWGKYPAVVTNNFGKGTSIYQATILTDELQEAVIINKCKELKIYSSEVNLKFPIVSKNSISNQGKQLHFYLNYSDKTQSFIYPYSNGTELLSSKSITSKSNLSIEPWGVKIIEEK
ncbi:MAG: beta-galactosidase [Cytophagales bacterium]|nr:MAG: beta-galactosidase [Cytophagales bacterium]